ncbi:MAG TPA: tRNA epoxyqueuosine(34) reductase QueG [Longimicrobiales bacterium]
MKDTTAAAGAALSDRIRAQTRHLGFDLVGITDVRPSEHAGFYRAWLAAGRHGEMSYLARPDAVERRLRPDTGFAGVRSAIVVGLDYYTADDDEADAARGIIARYARGRDYHKVIKRKLLHLLRWLEDEVGHRLPLARAYVDTGPVLERELARRAGLGWFGRNTMLLNPKRGSFFFLATLLTELELEPDAPFEADHCGTCSACVSACPTGALLGRDANGAPVIDATRCISYLTIEQRGPIPRELRPLIGNRIFGCDICQEVCPFTGKFSAPSSEPSFAARGPAEPPVGVEKLGSDGWHPGTASPSLIDLMSMDEAAWEAFSRGSALRRAGRSGFRRNVAVALGNWGSSEAVPVLVRALLDAEPLVRGHAAWALGEIASPQSLPDLEASLAAEREPFVLEEVEGALDRLRSKVE